MRRLRSGSPAFVVCVGVLTACLLVPLAAAEPEVAEDSSPELQAVLERFDSVQESIRTLSSDLTMTTTHRLLKDPVVYRGRFYMTKPKAVRWEFETPEEMRFVIANDQYVGYYPAQNRAERKNIRRWSDQLFRYFGLGQGSAELAKFYRISLAKPGPELKDCYLLVMEPKKRRARKRVEGVQLWVDSETMLPVKVEYRGTDGSTRTVEFRNVQLNVDLAANLYTVELPADVEIRTGFTPFGGAEPGS